jgi:hypothetical protein
MKTLSLIALLLPALASAEVEKIEGVPFSCVDQIRYEMIRRFAAENREDREAVEAFKEYVRSAPAYACKRRKNPKVEDVTWCDGSGCSGATATLANGRCVVTGHWSGQDDGDVIDPVEHKASCLVKSDFRR